MEELGDDGDDRDDGCTDPEKANTSHQRLNGASRTVLGLLRPYLLLKVERGGVRRLFGESVAKDLTRFR